MALSKQQIRGILDDVIENNKRLNSCPGPHDFVEIEGSPAWSRKYRCEKCQGTVNSSSYLWYQRGLTDGKKTDAD